MNDELKPGDLLYYVDSNNFLILEVEGIYKIPRDCCAFVDTINRITSQRNRTILPINIKTMALYERASGIITAHEEIAIKLFGELTNSSQ